MTAHFARECAVRGFEQRIAHFSSEAHVALMLIRESGAVCLLHPAGGTPARRCAPADHRRDGGEQFALGS